MMTGMIGAVMSDSLGDGYIANQVTEQHALPTQSLACARRPAPLRERRSPIGEPVTFTHHAGA
jgi:hypothetical protein